MKILKELKLLPLIISLTAPFIAGGIGSFFTTPAIDNWYASLQKPFFNPPNWVFGPVWTTLYLLMGVSFYFAWINRSNLKEKTVGIKYFFIQLGLNTLWSVVFFGLKSPFLALLIIIALWVLIFLTLKNFLKISRLAGLLLIPYLAWVGFAGVLNLAITLLN